MSVPLLAAQADVTDDILGGYEAFCATLGLSDDAVELRGRLACRFLAAHPHLDTFRVAKSRLRTLASGLS